MEKFGKYQLLRRIGSGGMAEVFLARTTVAQGLNKQLVIKKIHPAYARSRQFVAMFVDEAKIALGLNHPNIVQVFDFGQVGDSFFLAMELVEGLDVLRLLQEISRRGVIVPFGLSAFIVQQVARGLDYAHRKTDEFGEPLAIVHRDVSPQNVLVSWDGAVKLVDFGIARARHVHEEEGVVKGKFAYMSPEQARGDGVDQRADVFAAGVVLFELVCGRPLFPGKGKEVLDKVIAGDIPRARDVNPAVPPGLDRVIGKALAFRRDDRYQTARDLQNALGRFQLEDARDTDELVDSSALAQLLAGIVPADKRTPSQLPPSARGPASVRGRDTGVSDVERFDTGEREPTGEPSEVRERKHVYVLEGAVCGRQTTRSPGMLGDFTKVAKNIAYKLDAHVHRIDERGFTFVVGMPVAAEDDATRTIRLALALVDALDGIGADVEPDTRLAVGIQRGVALLRRRGGRRLDYELAESTTSIARKLASEAQGGEVLVGGRVYRVARADWSFEPLTAIVLPADADTHPGTYEDLEGSVQKARVYRLRGPKERAERLRERTEHVVELVGRQLELKALRDAYRDVLVSRRKQQVAVIGETGIGKRTLVNAFVDGIPPGEAIVLRAATRVATAFTPYAVVADLGRDLLGLAEGAAAAEVHKRLERLAPLIYPGAEDSAEAQVTIRAVATMLGVPTGGRDMDAAELRQRLLQVMLRIEQRLAPDKPIVLIGEDVHWSDDETLELFRSLLRIDTSRPILGIVTSRPDDRVEATADEVDAQLIRLDELDERSRLALITSRFVPDHDIAELARKILSRTGGNPLFIREILDALEERGILVADDDEGEYPGLLRWIDRGATIAVPTSIEALLATRCDRLPVAEKDALVYASVIGRRFGAPEVGALLGRPAEGLLDSLVRRGLLTRDGQYAFRNDMTMTVAYGMLPASERTRLHRDMARRIADGAGYRPGPDDGVIARHLELAGDAAEAAERYLAAANHAVDVGGNADAFRQLTRALKLLPERDHERRFHAHRRREEVLARLVRRPQQLREIHAMRKEAEALASPAKLALTHARLAQFYIDVGKAPAASRAVGPALQHAREAGDALAEAEALRLRAAIARLVGQNEEALRLSGEALALCTEDPRGLAQRALILNNRGTTLWNMSRLEAAIEAYAEALVIYRMLKLPRLEARALNNMGIVFAALGEFEEALAHYKSALKIEQDMGDRAAIALKLANIGQTYADIGDVERAERYLTKALKLAEQLGDGTTSADAAISLGQVCLARGERRRALAHLERGLELASKNRDRYQEIRALTYLGMGQIEAGHPPEGALELARSATELAKKMPMPIGQIFGLSVQGLALARMGRPDDAADASAEAVAIQTREGLREGAELVFHIHAQLAEKAGRLGDARAAIERARAEVEAKAEKLADPQLRALFRAARTPSAIARDYQRLVGGGS